MLIDEFYFHWQRGLPRWERIGHPLDTLTVLVGFLFLLLVAPSASAAILYVGIALFSCLFVTKDEWVHKRFCRAGEQWLHALLFLLHPLIFLSGGLLWQALHTDQARGLSSSWIRYEGMERTFLLIHTSVIFLFGLYQLLYWNLLWKNDTTAPSTTRSMTS